MANVFAKEFYASSKKENPHTPSVGHKLRDKPCVSPSQSNEKDSKHWRDSFARKSMGPSQQLSLQAWILYIIIFALTGDLCNSWKSFGCLAAQLSHLSISRQIGVAENATFAIARGSELRHLIQRMARKRDSNADVGEILSEENDEVKRYLKSLDLGNGRWGEAGATTFGASRKKSNIRKGSVPKETPNGKGKSHGVNTKGDLIP